MKDEKWEEEREERSERLRKNNERMNVRTYEYDATKLISAPISYE